MPTSKKLLVGAMERVRAGMLDLMALSGAYTRAALISNRVLQLLIMEISPAL